MKSLLTDPVVITSVGAILFGLIGFMWGIRKLRAAKSQARQEVPVDDIFPADAPSLPDLNRSPLPLNIPVAPAVQAAAPVSREVADRLESMTQRLAEMQNVLMKQSSTGSTSQTGGVGQGFSPETIDKLLKIVGNVIQQVDILQKSLNVTK